MGKVLIFLTLSLLVGLAVAHRHHGRDESRGERQISRDFRRSPSRVDAYDNRFHAAIPRDRRDRGFGWGRRPIWGGRRHHGGHRHGHGHGGCHGPPTTVGPVPTTGDPITNNPTPVNPSSVDPVTDIPTTVDPVTEVPTTVDPTTVEPTTV